MIRNNNILEGIIDVHTGESVTYEKITGISDGDCDGVILRKYGTEYFKRVITGGYYDIRWFGADPTGVLDSYPAFAKAVQITAYTAPSYTSKAYLFLPKGNYKFSTGHDSYTGVELNGGTGFCIIGEEGTRIFTTSTSDYNMFRLQYGAKNMLFLNIHFEDLHGLTTEYSTAISTIKGGGDFYEDLKIVNCKFTGWGKSIILQGTKKILIDYCKFYSPKGHDNAISGTNYANPAVYIWALNDYGINEDVNITNCYAEGYSGTDITTTASKAAMDGFIFGRYKGGLIENNTMIGFAEEAILISPFSNDLDTRNNNNKLIIRNNYINSTPYAGALNTGTNIPKSFNYGIRVDQSNVEITNNRILGVTIGIMYRGFDFSGLFRNIKITDNHIELSTLPNADTLNALFIQGSSDVQSENIVMYNNHIIADGCTLNKSLSLIIVGNLEKSYLGENSIYIRNMTKNGFSLSSISLETINTDLKITEPILLGDNVDDMYSYGIGSVNTNIKYRSSPFV